MTSACAQCTFLHCQAAGVALPPRCAVDRAKCTRLPALASCRSAIPRWPTSRCRTRLIPEHPGQSQEALGVNPAVRHSALIRILGSWRTDALPARDCLIHFLAALALVLSIVAADARAGRRRDRRRQRLSAALGASAGGAPPAAAQGRGRAAGASPASQRPPQTVTPQSYPPEQVKAGQACSPLSAASATAATRPAARAAPTSHARRSWPRTCAGDKIGPVVRSGRPDKGMPRVHRDRRETSPPSSRSSTTSRPPPRARPGGRRSVDVADLQTGNADAGRRYFEGACAQVPLANGQSGRDRQPPAGSGAAAAHALPRDPVAAGR